MSDVKKFVDLFPYGTCFHLSRDGNLSCRYSELDSSCVDFIEDATNKHDRLVEENAELREAFKELKSITMQEREWRLEDSEVGLCEAQESLNTLSYRIDKLLNK